MPCLSSRLRFRSRTGDPVRVPPPMRRSSTDALVVFVAALVPRLALLASGRDDPVARIPMLDAEYAVDWARRIAAGDFWGSPEAGAYFRPPLYEWFLAAAFRLPGDDLGVALGLQALLGAATAALLADISRRRFGRLAGFATGALAALAWPLLFFSREFLIAPLELFLIAALLRLLDGATPASRTARWIAAGALVGAGALTRPNLVTVAPAAVLVAALAYGRSGALRRAVLVALGTGLVVAPVTVRNRVISGDWVPIATQGGLNLWIGNHPDSDGMTATLPGFSSWRNEDVSAWLAREEGRPLSAAEEDAYFRRRFLELVADDPVMFLRGLARKTYLFAQGYEIRNNRDLYAARTRDRLLAWPLPDFGWIAPLALVGLAASRRRARELAFLWSHALAAAAGVILVFVCARYRLAAWPALLVFAGAGVAAILAPDLPARRRVAYVGLLSVAVVLARVDFLHIRGIDWAQTHLQWGNSYARAGRDADARREYDEALRADPSLAEARFHRGALLLRQGRTAESLADLRAAAQSMPFSFRARRSLAEALESAGRLDEAVAVRREALALAAGASEEKLSLATTLAMSGRSAEALGLFRELATERQHDPYFLLNAGQTALVQGAEAQGLAWVRGATADPATAEDAWAALGTYYASTARPAEAQRALDDGVAALPRSPRLLALRALLRDRGGDRAGAIADLERALAQDPSNADARKQLAAWQAGAPSGAGSP